MDPGVAGATDALVDGPAGEAIRAGLAGAVDLGDEDHLGLIEHREKFRQQGPGAAVAVGLEGHHQAAVGKGLGQAGQGGANLRGVMAVIVHHQDAPGFALDLAAAVDLAQVGEALLPGRELQAQEAPHGAGGHGVQDVMGPRQGQGDGPQGLAPAPQAEAVAQPLGRQVGGVKIGPPRLQAVGDQLVGAVWRGPGPGAGRRPRR